MIPYSAASGLVKELFDAVRAGDLGLAQDLLARGASPNVFDSQGRTPLITAAGAIPEHRAEPDTPLAADSMIRALLLAGADPDWRSFNDRTPLMHAAASGNATACVALLAAGAAVDLQNRKGRSALMHSANALKENVVRLLIESGAQVNLVDATGKTALDFVAGGRPGSQACRRWLRKAGAKVGNGPLRRRLKALRRYFNALRSHFTLDEPTQHRRRPLNALLHALKRSKILPAIVVIGCVTMALQVFMPLLLVAAPWISLGLWLALSLVAFPAVVQLPYVLITSIAAMKAPGRPRTVPDPELMIEDSGESVDYVSNFVRLGWNSLAQAAREGKQMRLLHILSYLASVALAFAIPVMILVVSWATIFFGRLLVRPLGLSSGTSLSIGILSILFVTLLVVLLALWAEDRLRARRLKAFQVQQDRIAADIARSMEDHLQRQTNEASDFLLYLRTFGVTGKLDVGGIDLETAMAYHLDRMLPVVALGKPGEALGAGRILTTDQHWKEEILRLIEKAKLIMIIPSHHEGTLWEIGRLRDGSCFDKTIFVMPPEIKIDGAWLSEAWGQAVEAALGLGLFLPPHYPEGLMFKLDAAGQAKEHAPFGAEQFLSEMAATHPNIHPDSHPDVDGDSGRDGDGWGDSDGSGDDSSGDDGSGANGSAGADGSGGADSGSSSVIDGSSNSGSSVSARAAVQTDYQSVSRFPHCRSKTTGGLPASAGLPG